MYFRKKLHFRCVTGSEFAYDYKRFLRKTKELYQGFLARWLLLVSRDFTCTDSTKEKLETLEQDLKCV